MAFRMLLRPLFNRQRGQASIIAALTLPLFATLALGAVDAGQWLLQRQKLTEFTRIAAMNIGSRAALSEKETEAKVTADADQITNDLALIYFNDDRTNATTLVQGGKIIVRAEREIDSLFLGNLLANFNQVEVSYSAEASFSNEPGALDMSFVVDVSSSMGSALSSGVTSSNLAQLQQILLNLIDILPASVAMGLVPYHELGGVTINGTLWLPDSYAQPLCADGRGAGDDAGILAQLFNDPNNITVATEPQRGGDFLAENCPSQKVIPLTTDHTFLQQSIRQMPDAEGSSTASLQGFIWGVRSLLENWRGRWNLEDLPRPNNVADKVMVLLTDGADGTGRSTMRNLIDMGMCDQVRARGIDLWFIGFGTGRLRADDYFSRCFGNQALTADNAQELNDAIVQIIASSSRAKLRLLKDNNK